MPRVRKGAARNKARKKLLKAARGYWGTKSRHKQQAKVALTRAGQFAYRDRRARRRDLVSTRTRSDLENLIYSTQMFVVQDHLKSILQLQQNNYPSLKQSVNQHIQNIQHSQYSHSEISRKSLISLKSERFGDGFAAFFGAV